MKILLAAINAKYIHSSLSLRSIAAYNREYADYMEVREYTINNDVSRIAADIQKEVPDVVGISCYIWNYSYVREITDTLGKVMPHVHIWLGGPEVSFDAEKTLRSNPYVFGIIRGEGEGTWKDLISGYITGRPEFKAIKGITYRQGEDILFNEDREPIDMDDIPFCYDDLSEVANKIVYYEGSRGCPFNCSYCLSSIDRRLRKKSIDKIKGELDRMLEARVPQVKFIDRTFNCDHLYAKEIWRYISEKDTGCTNFHFEIGADLLDQEEIDIITHMREGLIQLEIGVQSTNTQTLEAIHRKANFHDLARNVKAIKEAGNVHQHLDLIAGLPYEGYESFQKSFDDVYALRPDQLQLGFLKVLKGSEMYRRQQEYGIKYTGKPPYEVLETKYLCFSEIRKIKLVEEMTEVYYNSRQFEKTLLMLEREYPSAFGMFYDLGCFYEDRDLLAVNHSRIARYEILRAFLREKGFGPEEIYDEAMIFDLYLRENLKSRPEWAGKPGDYREFYEDEKNAGYFADYEGYSIKQIMRATHIEHFHVDFTRWKDRAFTDTEETDVLFDYKNRRKIDNSARIVKI